jgi:hypothetical protein
MPGESYALNVDSDDIIDNFLTPANIFYSWAVAPRKEWIYWRIWWPCMDTKILRGGSC